MGIVKVSELNSRIGTVIPSIQGTIVSVFPPKEGKGEHGAWKLQNISIEDGTGLCQVTLSGLVDSLDDSHKGKEIYFESTGTKFGLKGVSVEKRSYQNKSGVQVETVGVKVTKTALIKWIGQEGVQEDAKEPSDLKPQATLKAFKAESLMNTVSTCKDAPQVNVDDVLHKYSKLYSKCLWEANQMELEDSGDLSVTDVKDIASCFFIQGVRDGLLNHIKLNETPSQQVEKDDIPF